MRYYRAAGSTPSVAHGVVMRAAAVVIIAAASALQRAATPGEALLSILEDATAGRAGGARVVAVTDGGWWGGRNRSRRRGARVWGVRASLQRVGRLDGDATFAVGWLDVTLHPDVAGLAPAATPGIPDNPVVLAILCTITNSGDTMVKRCSTCSGKDTLRY
jgi:hypothetical protein